MIVGGGVMGASIAYHLGTRGVKSVLVLERDTLGSGSTGKNAGGIRQQFSTETNVRLSQLSVPRFERFQEEFGTDIAFQQVGYLFLITDEGDVAPFQRSLALWQRLGVPARRVERDEIRSIFPEIVVDDILFGTFCHQDGHADSSGILNGFVARAREGGARFREHAAVTGVDVDGGRVRAVRVGDERIPCEVVIDAAGAWAPQVAKMVGLEMPIRPLRRHVFITDDAAGLEHPIPLTIEFASTLYMHRESGGILLGMADPDEPASYNESVNWDFLPAVIERGLARFPALARTTVRTGWAGLYEDTPDKHPIIGCVEGVEGFVAAAGFSGHGLMHSPAVGEIVADLVTGRPPRLDIGPLSLARFNAGQVTREHNVI